MRGDITDAGSLQEAARRAEAVVHAALMHGEGAEEAELTVVGAMLDVLWGTGRTFVYNSGVWVMGDTPEGVDLADEETRVDPPPMFTWRPGSAAYRDLKYFYGSYAISPCLVRRPGYDFGWRRWNWMVGAPS